jgi:FkbM family methyltransferase
MNEWLKHAVIRTPFEGPAKLGRNVMDARQLIRHPEKFEVWAEETRIARLFSKILTLTSNCVDVGAHLGINLSQFVRRAPKGRHIAFEPNPQQAEWLRKKFPEVDVRTSAVSDKDGEMDFFLNDNRSGFSGLRRLGDAGESFRSIRIAVGTLDSTLPRGYRVDALKIVVEGAELSVLRGAREILHRDRPTILIECVPANLAHFGATSSDVFDFLTVQHSYSIFLIKDFLKKNPPLGLDQFETAQRYPFQAMKFVAAPG